MRAFFIFYLIIFVSLLSAQKSELSNSIKTELARQKNVNKNYTLLVQGNTAQLLALQKQFNYTFHYSAGDIASITCKADALALLLKNKIITYAELKENHINVLNDTMLVRNRIQAVKAGAVPLSQPYDGSGIIVGIIDTGIDFNHPDFKDGWGSSRIKYLWDQVPASGSTVPAPFNYGIEWSNAQINANQCTHNPASYFGHGTHVSGIAAGNGLSSNKHEGCAPLADIIAVALDFNKSGSITADAVQYIFNKATQLGKPCVINASVGDYYGSHDATDLEAKLIENMVKNTPGRVIVAAAGNGGNSKFHVKTQPGANDTVFTWLSNNGTSLQYWFYGDTTQIKNLQMSVGANRSDYSDLGRIGFKNYNYGLVTVQHDTLKHNGNRIGVIHNSSAVNPSGVYELYLQIDADTTGLLWRIESKGQGLHHAWNFDFVSSGLPSSAQYPHMMHYIKPDSLYTLVSSYQCSDEVISVANYHNLGTYYDVNNALQNTGALAGSIGPTSSSGPTRDERQKPDIAASGNFIFSSLVISMQASVLANTPSVVAQGSMHIRGGGTSAASPVVAGLAALYLQAHPTASNLQVKNAITQCAYSDFYTGSNLPNARWGYGKLDGFAAMICGENPVGILKIKSTEGLMYSPNPFHDKVSIALDKAVNATIEVFGSDGKLLLEETFSGSRYELCAEKLTGNNYGLLFVKILTYDKTYALKLIRE